MKEIMRPVLVLDDDCVKCEFLNSVDIKEVKDAGELVFRNVNGRLCAYLVKETFAGYLDEGTDGERKYHADLRSKNEG